MLNSKVSATGKVNIVVQDEDGTFDQNISIDNLVVLVGRQYIASRMKDSGPAQMSHMAIGTGATSTSLDNTTLQSEVARVALLVSGGVVTGNQVTYTATFPAGTPASNVNFSEAAILNAASLGIMLARVVFPTVTKLSTQSISITWTVTIN